MTSKLHSHFVAWKKIQSERGNQRKDHFKDNLIQNVEDLGVEVKHFADSHFQNPDR
jgi:hypothetical protein